LLLFWYKTSVHQAHASVIDMARAPLGGGLVRSLHRYSSDACMLFVCLHAAKYFFARRFSGTRWLAWVTGLSLVGLLWLVGWLGYWLVWDDRAQRVALGTARLLDQLPIFADPLSRSFLSDHNLSSLLFFVVFFVHMLLPLAMGICLWLHIARLSRPRFLTRRWLTLWTLGSLVVMSAALPADVTAPARMTLLPQDGAIDYWYLAPLVLVDRLSAGALWLLLLLGGALAFSVPWWLARGRARIAQVESGRCNACKQCVEDCPYDAIQLVPRQAARRAATVAAVDPAKCVGCGICSGSCNSSAIGIRWFDQLEQRRRVDGFIEAAASDHAEPAVAFVCAASAGSSLSIDAGGSAVELPGYRVLRVPCAGWVEPLTVERAMRRGAGRVLIVGCGPGACTYREGTTWTRQRLEGGREPRLRTEKLRSKAVLLLELFRSEKPRLVKEAAVFLRGAWRDRATASPLAQTLLGAVLAAGFGLAVWGATRVGYASPARSAAELVVSFKHPGKSAEQCRPPTEEELRKLPAHMRPKQICSRRRADVRMRVTVDGRALVRRSYPPRGVWHDGNSIALERLPLASGVHDVIVEIGDTPDTAFSYRMERRVTLRDRHTPVIAFDKLSGFAWHE
jgi:coenzyme F420-reducing hydrogenase delta subunit/NAD-dependent dihydropyrimidine dehydrogenase PreA subunit